MSRFLKIRNRGSCPRLMLEIFGATAKRDRASDASVIGINGTGTKCAPVAACRLGIGVAVTSSDGDGPYFVRYLPRQQRLGELDFVRLVMTYDEDVEVPMPCFTTAARHWDSPIGSDSMRTFRVLREYLTNAYDEDRVMDHAAVAEEDIVRAEEGQTIAYLSWHQEFDGILHGAPARYFKWLSSDLEHFHVAGLGAIWPKSDPDQTRLFCQGTLAACIPQATTPSAFDWCTADKRRLSEDREFRELTATYADFHRLLRQLTDVGLAERILAAALHDSTSVEHHALVAPVEWPKDGRFPSKDAWRQAWLMHAGSQAVISSSDHEHDEIARYSYGKTVVRVESLGLRAFLRRCGVQESKEFVPQLKPKDSYRTVEPDEEEQRRLDEVLKAVCLEHPGAAMFRCYVYEPLTADASRQAALTDFDGHGRPIRIGIQRAVVRGPIEGLVHSVLHELIHALLPTQKHGLEFTERQGREWTRLFMQKHGIVEGQALDPEPEDP